MAPVLSRFDKLDLVFIAFIYFALIVEALRQWGEQALVQLEESRLRRFLRDPTRFPPARGATLAGDAGENVVRTGLGHVDYRRPAPYSPPTRSGRYRSAGRAVPT